MIYCNDRGGVIARHKIAITLDDMFLQELERLVQERDFKNRSQAIQFAE